MCDVQPSVAECLMQRRRFLKISLLAPLAAQFDLAHALPLPRAAVPNGKPHQFAFRDRAFVLDGVPFQIRSGQMDPIRIPRGYWRQRIQMAKAMGLNTIALYVMWNALEPEPGKFDLTSGRRDFARFIDLCGEEGMWVYLRPGPYVCAEWDFGGLPAWLLRDPGMRVRHADDVGYMRAVARYFDAIAPLIRPRMTAQGGPVLMLQLENEYASFGSDPGYLQTLQTMWQQRGIEGPFALSDGLQQIAQAKTYVPGTALGLDGDTDFAKAQVIAGEAPVWLGEGYTGWLSHWGDPKWQQSDYAATLRKLMADRRSFNLYEVHGGTNFGFGAGANAQNDGSHFLADLTSYDYGAPINEQGAATPDYHRCRAAIVGALRRSLPDIPAAPPASGFEPVIATPWTDVWNNLPPPRHVAQPKANELLTGQTQGMVLYRKRVRLDKPATLRVSGVHDYASVLVDGKLAGVISRVQGSGLPVGDTLALPARPSGTAQLDILIDSFGHVGYGRYIDDRKGLTGAAEMDGKAMADWQVFSLPLDDAYVRALQPSADAALRPGVFFRARIARRESADCYLDMRRWDKGYVWVNGHLLGRYWRIGPQQRLYCPAEWWHAGDNDVLVFDQQRTVPTPIRGEVALHD